MNRLVSRRTASLLLAGGLCTLMGASLSACASAKTADAGSGGTAPGPGVSATSTHLNAPSPASSPGTIPGGDVPPPVDSGGTATGSVPAGITQTPRAQLSAVPAGARLTPFETAATSGDGRTLFVGLESMGGACGQYEVVLQQSSTVVDVGLVHLADKGVMCPMYIAPIRIPVQLAAPLGGRAVVDLANDQRLNVS